MTLIRLIPAAALGLAVSANAMSAATDLDANGDGTYSFEEMLVAMPALTEETYGEIDANADGTVDPDELAAAQASGLVTLPEG